VLDNAPTYLNFLTAALDYNTGHWRTPVHVPALLHPEFVKPIHAAAAVELGMHTLDPNEWDMWSRCRLGAGYSAVHYIGNGRTHGEEHAEFERCESPVFGYVVKYARRS